MFRGVVDVLYRARRVVDLSCDRPVGVGGLVGIRSSVAVHCCGLVDRNCNVVADCVFVGRGHGIVDNGRSNVVVHSRIVAIDCSVVVGSCMVGGRRSVVCRRRRRLDDEVRLEVQLGA